MASKSHLNWQNEVLLRWLKWSIAVKKNYEKILWQNLLYVSNSDLYYKYFAISFIWSWFNIIVLPLTIMVAEGLVWVTLGLAPSPGCCFPMYLFTTLRTKQSTRIYLLSRHLWLLTIRSIATLLYLYNLNIDSISLSDSSWSVYNNV